MVKERIGLKMKARLCQFKEYIAGKVTERPKVHDWKSCVRLRTEGSNPSLSAKQFINDGFNLNLG